MGIHKFRSNRVNLKYFVPTYGSPANGFEQGAVDKIISSFNGKLNFKQDLFIKGSSMDQIMHFQTIGHS